MPLSAQGQHDSKVVILVFVKWPPSEAIKGRAFVLIWFGFSRQSIFRLCEPVKEDQHLSRNVFRTTFDSSFSPISTFAKLKSAKIKVVIEMSQSVMSVNFWHGHVSSFYLLSNIKACNEILLKMTFDFLIFLAKVPPKWPCWTWDFELPGLRTQAFQKLSSSQYI